MSRSYHRVTVSYTRLPFVSNKPLSYFFFFFRGRGRKHPSKRGRKVQNYSMRLDRKRWISIDSQTGREQNNMKMNSEMEAQRTNKKRQWSQITFLNVPYYCGSTICQVQKNSGNFLLNSCSLHLNLAQLKSDRFIKLKQYAWLDSYL